MNADQCDGDHHFIGFAPCRLSPSFPFTKNSLTYTLLTLLLSLNHYRSPFASPAQEKLQVPATFTQ